MTWPWSPASSRQQFTILKTKQTNGFIIILIFREINLASKRIVLQEVTLPHPLPRLWGDRGAKGSTWRAKWSLANNLSLESTSWGEGTEAFVRPLCCQVKKGCLLVAWNNATLLPSPPLLVTWIMCWLEKSRESDRETHTVPVVENCSQKVPQLLLLSPQVPACLNNQIEEAPCPHVPWGPKGHSGTPCWRNPPRAWHHWCWSAGLSPQNHSGLDPEDPLH